MSKSVLIWNAHWGTAGGGERYALTLGMVLVRNGYEVTFAGPKYQGLEKLFTTFRIDPFLYQFLETSEESDVSQHARRYDIFVNGSFGSGMLAPILNSVFICHFPTLSRRAKLSKRINRRLFKNTIALNLFGLIQNPQIDSQLWFNDALFLHIPNDRSIEIHGHEGNFMIRGEKGIRNILSGQNAIIQGPDNLLLMQGTSIKFSGKINGIKTITGWRVLLTRYLPFPLAHHSYLQVWANSEFTKKWISNLWKIESRVIYPPVKVHSTKQTSKDEFAIVSLGRFMSPKRNHSKNQLELVKGLRLISKANPSFHLTLLGNLAENQRSYFKKVQKLARNKSVAMGPNASMAEVEIALDSSTYYWHGAGLNQPESKPQNFEHFGIAPIEAMSSGLIPLVYKEGGPAEVLADFPELIYENLHDLAKKTLYLSNQNNTDLIAKLKLLSNRFNVAEFEKRVIVAFKKLS